MNARIQLASLGTLAFLTLLVPPAFAANPPDKNLEAALRDVLHEPKKELTDELYNRVYVLDAVNKGIKDLTGLEKCKNLRSLRLTRNQISDVKPLAGLAELQSLDLANNQIADIKPLATLTNLQYLELSHNKVTNIEPLKGLTKLNSLYLTGNQISDIAPVAGLNRLWSLYLAKNQIKDIGPLAKLTRLSTLDLSDNQIENIAPLANMTEINLLMLERNRITDLKPLVAAAEKDAGGPKRFAPFLRLYLAGNPVAATAQKAAIEAGPKTQWEYKVLAKDQVNELGKGILAAGLNQLGQKGWELSAVDNGSYILKRHAVSGAELSALQEAGVHVFGIAAPGKK
jgi:internalin A